MEDLFNVASASPGPRREGPHRLRRAARARALRARRVQQPARCATATTERPRKQRAAVEHPPDLQRNDGSRALAPGSRRPRRVALGRLAVAALVSVGAYARPLRGGARPPAADRYGQIPSWLPKAKLPVGRAGDRECRPPVARDRGRHGLRPPAQRARARDSRRAGRPRGGQVPGSEDQPCSFTVTFTAASSAHPAAPQSVHDPRRARPAPPSRRERHRTAAPRPHASGPGRPSH